MYLYFTGIGFSSGEVWKHQRKFSLGVFRSFGVGKKSFEERIATEAENVFKELSALSGERFNPKHYLMNATSNVICSVIFGDRFEYNDEEFKRILSIMDRRVQLVGSGGITVNIPLLRFLNSGMIQKLTDILKEAVEYFKAIVKRHKTRLEATDECTDYIDLYLKEIEKNCERGDVESHDFIDEAHLIGTIDSLFLAGTETTSNTLLWCLLYMANYPDVQRKVQDEIEAVCGERLPSFDDQGSMPYTEAVISEIQRLHTVVPLGECDNRQPWLIIIWEEYDTGNGNPSLTTIQNGACTLCHSCSSLASTNTMHKKIPAFICVAT